MAAVKMLMGCEAGPACHGLPQGCPRGARAFVTADRFGELILLW